VLVLGRPKFASSATAA